MLNWLSILLATTSPPALASKFSEVKAHPGLLYFQVEAQRSACLKVPEPMTLFRMPLRILPAVLDVLLDELLDELPPPSNPPRIPATVEAVDPDVLDAAVLAVEGVVVLVVVVVEAFVVAVVFLVVVVFLLVVFFVVFLTGQLVISESDVSLRLFATLPVVQAITRAAVRITFFIVFSILCLLYPLFP